MSKKLNALLKTFEGRDKVSVIHSAFGESPSVVAFVECPATMTTDEKLEYAFMKPNSIDDAWWNNKEVTAMFPNEGCRSTSVGDQVLVGNTKYECSPYGWELVT